MSAQNLAGDEVTAAIRSNPGWALYQLGRQARNAFADALKERGLQPAHYGVLLWASTRSGADQRELSRRVGVDRSDMVDLIDALEATDLVRRVRDPQDRRRNTISLTPQGRLALAEMDHLVATVNERFFANLDAREREALWGLLEKLLKQREA
ncbi:MAG: MarR family winged helix-turn-helix transcriptional regulator [Candidatus Limnocylindrales bacterium]